MATKKYTDEFLRTDIVPLGPYHPYKIDGERNPCFDGRSGRILDIKNPKANGHQGAIAAFTQELLAEIPHLVGKNDRVVCGVVPAHAKGEYSAGLAEILRRVSGEYANLQVHPDLLTRTQTIAKLTGGGSRNMSVHTGSISVKRGVVTRGAKVLVLDDVTTTGGSLRACRHLLQGEGAGLVVAVVLGKTTWP
jgi:predicted amidophosphoribosyltransferase